MSTPQGNDACRISVDPSTADVLRIEAKKVLMFNHDPFEDFLDYVPTKQLALADVFRDATAVIDALGWDPEDGPDTDSIEVPLTRGHVEQLHERRCDLLATNLDLLTDIGADNATNAVVMSEIYAQPPRRRSPQQGLRRLQRHHHAIARRTSVVGPDPATELRQTANTRHSGRRPRLAAARCLVALATWWSCGPWRGRPGQRRP